MADGSNINWDEFNNALDTLYRGMHSYQQATSSIEEVAQTMLQYSQKTLNDVKSTFSTEDEFIKKVFDATETAYNEIITKLQAKLNSFNETLLLLDEEISNTSNTKIKQDLQERKEEIIQEQEKYRELLKAINEGSYVEYENKLRHIAAKEDLDKREEKLHEEELSKRRQFIDSISRLTSDGLREYTQTYKDAITNITSVYNQTAGKLSAMLDSSVSDIQKLQTNIAAQLRNADLSTAISNVEVLNEAVSMASAGFTNEATLQQSATDIAIGKRIAPTIDFSSATVKNLVNVFGSDFTHKFAAIAQATQDTAGSTAGVKETLSGLTTSLEPVFLNAELQSAALQGTADVAATLASAQQQGLIGETDVAEYRRLLVELMDPSKAFSSSSVAVRMAASTSPEAAFSGDPAKALEALLNARQQMYGNVAGDLSSTSIMMRGIYASAMGDNPLTAAYKPEAYTQVEMARTSDLESTYEEQLAKLQGGEYTTAAERNRNVAENSPAVQSIAKFSENFPRTYTVMSTLILNAIRGLPNKIGKQIYDSSKEYGSFGGRNGGTGTGTLKERLNKSLAGRLKSREEGTSLWDAIKGSSFRSEATKPLALASYAAGAMGLTNVISSAASGTGWTNEGDIGFSMQNYAGIGSAVGSLIGAAFGSSTIGSLIGGGAGAIGGLIAASVANTKALNEAKEAQEKQTQTMIDTFGSITALSASERVEATASGGGYLTLSDGKQYAVDTSYYKGLKAQGYATGLDYVPYDDYLVRLHKGEAVVTANAAKQLRESNPNFWNSPSYDENEKVVSELEKQTRSIVGAINGEKDVAPLSQQNGMQQFTIRNTSFA